MANAVTWAAGAGLVAVANTQYPEPQGDIPAWRLHLRNTSLGIDLYLLDWNAYPPDLNALTTPDAYLSSIYSDPFSGNGTSLLYHSHATPSSPEGFLLVWSVGPDGLPHIIPERLDALAVDPSAFRDQLLRWTYDPTNGTESEGDLLRVHPWPEP